MSDFASLSRLGWQGFFQQQLLLEEWGNVLPARIIEQHKSEIKVATADDIITLPLTHSMPEMVVGDWVLLEPLDNNEKRFSRLLDRKTCFARKAAGSKVQKQLISANVDTAFIVCSMNDDFNLNRIERFLSLVNESAAEAVIVLSKSDQADDPEMFIKAVQSIDPLLMVEAVNCLDSLCIQQLSPWIKEGATIAVLGSSGVGKSTLTNTLLGDAKQDTDGIREDDSKGRHTTTSRSLIGLSSGGLILDTPGMREIQLADCKEGIAATFADIEAYAEQCRFADCKHQSEPGCAIQQAVDSGELDARRLHNYHKLLKEEAYNSASLSDRRANDKALGKFYKNTLTQAMELKGR